MSKKPSAVISTTTVLWLAMLEGMVLAPKALSEESKWSYTGNEGPAYWSTLDQDYLTCGQGKNQSPINLTNMVEGKLPEISLQYSGKATEVVNNGHTIQVNYAPGSTLELNNKKFELKQFHFHSPSENTIKGESFPLEAHFVHADENGNLAVLALMLKEGEENQALQPVWEKMPLDSGEKEALTTPINTADILPSSHAYYRFNGSLTTPPCSEGVRWLVLKDSVTISKEQLEKFNQSIPFDNNRPVQPVNARVIVQ
ncbi:carbonic anhydrase [Hahella ganghwensis]|uniref:carbonic anhydrase n=1 Tax=Hahella ganghwensis TaxID=286420 RepID=UPI000368DC54|nr:carbonic anhydrase family protein [Hahella ganghwensis]